MMEVLVIDELREIRRRLAEQCGCDVQRYAAMLQETSRTVPGIYVKAPLLHLHSPVPEETARK